jgi:hypothetical protein
LQTKFADPGEMLVMDADGKFRIKNSNHDYRKFRATLFYPMRRRSMESLLINKQTTEINARVPEAAALVTVVVEVAVERASFHHDVCGGLMGCCPRPQ